MTAANIYDFELETIDGQPKALSEYEGSVLLLVNVASACGFTPQYTGLQKLHDEYASRGLVVLGIPANEFGAQEPGSNEEIQNFCTTRFHVTFPMFAKIVVKGAGQHPLYQWLTEQKGAVTWNFNKFLVDRQGHLIERFESKVAPESAELRSAIERIL